MPHHLDLYLDHGSPLHRLDVRAKLVGVAGATLGALLAPMAPAWGLAGVGGMVAMAAALARLPVRVVALRLAPLALVAGTPVALALLGEERARVAAASFAVKSLLIALAFLIVTATTRGVELLEAIGSIRLLGVIAPLAESIYRGVDLLAEEAARVRRAQLLRAPAASLRNRLAAVMYGSVSLLGRAAARSERVGAAMVLRGFAGRLPPPAPRRLPRWQGVAAGSWATLCVCLGAAARWG